MNNASYLRGVTYVVLAALCWSSAGLLIKLIHLPPLQIALFRSLIAGVFLMAYVGWLSRAVRWDGLFRITRHTLITAFLYMLTVTLFVTANKLTTSANAVFLQYTAPVYVIVVSYFFLKERVFLAEIVVIVVCLGGMVLFFFEEDKSASIVGNVVGILSGVAFALLQIAVRINEPARMRTDPAPEAIRSTFNLAFGNGVTVMVLAILVGLSSMGTWDFLESTAGTAIVMSSSDLVGLLILGVFQLGLGYLFFAKGAKMISSVEVSIYTLLEPVSNPVWTFLGTGERPGYHALGGAVLVLSAIVLNTLWERKKMEPSN